MSKAKEKLIEIIHNHPGNGYRVFPEHEIKCADAILAAGFVLPETPKPDIVEEEAKRLWSIGCPNAINGWPPTSHGYLAEYLALARDSLARQCESYLAGVRDRCGDGCECETCGRSGWGSLCGNLQRAAMRKYGQTTD